VAEEVQRLAESSRQATQQIAQLVNNIQIETSDTINTVNKTISQVVLGSEIAARSGAQMRETQQSTASLVELVKRITSSAQVQMKITTELRTRSAPARKKPRRRFCCSRKRPPISRSPPIASWNRYACSNYPPRPARHNGRHGKNRCEGRISSLRWRTSSRVWRPSSVPRMTLDPRTIPLPAHTPTIPT
jgi:hypothetical protein